MTEKESLVIKGFHPETKSKHSFIKLFYNHTTTKEFLLYIFAICCSVFAGISIIQNLGMMNDFVALLSLELTKEEKIYEFKKIFLKEIYWWYWNFFCRMDYELFL